MNKKNVFLIAFMCALIVMSISPVFAADVPSFEISPTSKQLNNGCSTTLQVMINTAGKVSNAADIIIKYDPTKLEILDGDPLLPGVQIIPGNAYDVYVGNEVDAATGTIKLTAFNSDLAERALFAEMKVQAKSGSGSTMLNILFFGHSYLNTKDSNIAEVGSSNDILEAVTNASIILGEGQCDKDIIPPQIQFSQPQNLQTGIEGRQTITFSLSDEGLGVDIATLVVTIDGVKYTATSPEVKITGDTKGYILTIDHKIDFQIDKQTQIGVDIKDFAGNATFKSIIVNTATTVPVDEKKCTPPRTFLESFLYEFQKDASIFVNALGPMDIMFLIVLAALSSGYLVYSALIYAMTSLGLQKPKGNPVVQVVNSSTNGISGIKILLVSMKGEILARKVSNNKGIVYADISQPFLVRLDSKEFVMQESKVINPKEEAPTKLMLISINSSLLSAQHLLVIGICVISFVFFVSNLVVFFLKANESALIMTFFFGPLFVYSLNQVPFHLHTSTDQKKKSRKQRRL